MRSNRTGHTNLTRISQWALLDFAFICNIIAFAMKNQSKTTPHETLRGRGLAMTVQRRAVLECLSGKTTHPTADDVFEEVREKMPEISRPTVYRVLETLVSVGLARRVDHPGSAARFDPRVDRHHHLVCSVCERIVDYEDPGLASLPLPTKERNGFKIMDYSVHFSGICRNCLREEKLRSKK